MDDLITAQRFELESFGVPPRFDIHMFPLLGEERPSRCVLIPAVTPQQRGIVEHIGMQFRRELGFDSAPFDPGDRDSEAALIVSRKFLATFPIAAGAAGLEHETDKWILKWVWLHPYERGTALFDEAWSELEERYGPFLIEGPYSPGGPFKGWSTLMDVTLGEIRGWQ